MQLVSLVNHPTKERTTIEFLMDAMVPGLVDTMKDNGFTTPKDYSLDPVLDVVNAAKYDISHGADEAMIVIAVIAAIEKHANNTLAELIKERQAIKNLMDTSLESKGYDFKP